jgi:hypothetical protein
LFRVYTSVISLKKTLCKIQNNTVQFPCIRPDDVVFRPDAHLSRHHLFGRRELFVRTPLCVQNLRTVLGCIRPNVLATCTGAFQCSTATTIWTTWLFCPDAILDKASRAEDVQLSGRQTPWSGRLGLNMEITCSRSATVQTLGQHRLDMALFRKEFQANLESRLHSCPSGRPQLLSGRRLGKSYQTPFRFL